MPGHRFSGLKIEVETDKVNHVPSSVFFMANRLSKASHGLAEFDRVMSSMDKASLESAENKELHLKFHKELDEILAKYF